MRAETDSRMSAFATLQERSLYIARDFIGIEEIGGDNLGPAVEFFQKLGEIGPGKPWCAAFVNACAEIAAAMKNLISPLEAINYQGYVDAYFHHEPAWRVSPEHVQPGDLFLIWFEHIRPGPRYAHIGFVDRVDWSLQSYWTVEGNSNDDGSREGFEVVRRLRPFHDKDAYLHWGAAA